MKTSMPSAHLPEAVVLTWPGVPPAPMRELPDRGPLDGASLEVLVEHARQGSTEAFGELVRLHQERLFNFLRQITGNDHDAQDLALPPQPPRRDALSHQQACVDRILFAGKYGNTDEHWPSCQRKRKKPPQPRHDGP